LYDNYACPNHALLLSNLIRLPICTTPWTIMYEASQVDEIVCNAIYTTFDKHFRYDSTII